MLKHIFIDIDRTLWDFEAASSSSLKIIFEEFQVSKLEISYSQFLTKYKPINEGLWNQLRAGEITKIDVRNRRFSQTLAYFGNTNSAWAEEIADAYVCRTSSIPSLFPGVYEALNDLHSRFDLHILSNGFKEAQLIKLESSGIRQFFKTEVYPEDCGFYKPDTRIFEFASKGLEPNSCLYIGDSYALDIVPARDFGWRQILFNPEMETVEDPQPTLQFYRWEHLPEFLARIL